VSKGKEKEVMPLLALNCWLEWGKIKRIREEIEVIHIATVECHSFECLSVMVVVYDQIIITIGVWFVFDSRIKSHG